MINESDAAIDMKSDNTLLSEANVSLSEANIILSEANIILSEANVILSEANIILSEANVILSEAKDLIKRETSSNNRFFNQKSGYPAFLMSIPLKSNFVISRCKPGK